MRRGERVEPPPAQQMRRERVCAKYVGEGVVEYIEPSRIGAKGRHHDTVSIRRKTATHDCMTTPGDAR